MGLQATIEAGVAAAFDAMGDLVIDLPLADPGTFDPVTEAETPGATGTVRAMQLSQADAEKYFAGLNWRGVAGDTQASDVQLMALASSATLTPKQDQTATWRGAAYNVHRIDDTQQALLLLKLRRPI
jgi:hypothetical protein